MSSDSALSLQSLKEMLRQAAEDFGFHLFGVAPAASLDGYDRLLTWLERGYAGEMDYIARRQEAYRHPEGVLPGVRSIVVLGFPYRTSEPAECEAGQGRVARYAWGTVDYHDHLHPKLKHLCRMIDQAAPDSRSRGVVDTAPLLEREVATLAGLGWAGKNTLLINRRQGSFFFLAAVLTTVSLPSDAPHVADHCGTCRACLDACPTDAFVGPSVMDANRCISYLTIEHRGAIPESLRPGMGNWLFGCDICQEVCPWNDRSDASDRSRNPDPRFAPKDSHVELVQLLRMSEDAFRQAYRKTPLWRSRRRGLFRNAAICLGNAQEPLSEEAVQVLRELVESDDPDLGEDGVVQESARWALRRHGIEP